MTSNSPPVDQLIPTHLDFLKQRFNIIDQFAIIDIDQDWPLFALRMASLRREFGPRDRILVTHCDVDYYDTHAKHGLSIRNLIYTLQSVDIPRYLLLLWTNHVGIKQEIDMLCQDDHPSDRPTVIESLMLNNHRPHTWYDVAINPDAIEIPALTMMYHQRDHRHALLNHTRHLHPEKIAISNWYNYK